ncbi:MAG: hypothetical protein JNL88_10990 [Bacteroidia bacterium]|nr:hypothetical protein [Bacteroidia bacterium]
MKSTILLFFGVVALFLASCGKEESFSPVPEITFERFANYKNAAGQDTAVDFVFSLKDGDGDIGFSDNEFDNSCGADNFNLYLSYEEKNGAGYRPKKLWLQVIDISPACDTSIYFDSVQVKFNQRMQYIEPAGNSKGIEATVTYRMDYTSALILLSTSGRFEFYIRDRANNLSNKIYSQDLNIVK